MKTQNQIYTTLAATLLLLLFAGQVSAQSMGTQLRNFGLLPAHNPYCGPDPDETAMTPGATALGASRIPYSTDNEVAMRPTHVCDPVRVSVGRGATGGDTNFPEGVVDWVLVEVRAETRSELADSDSVVARKPALLLRNGRVVDAQGFIDLDNKQACLDSDDVDDAGADACPAVSFGTDAFGGKSPAIDSGDSVFLVVRHRNHLGIQASRAATLDNNSYSYDFSTTTGVTTELVNRANVEEDTADRREARNTLTAELSKKAVGGTNGIKPRTRSSGDPVLAMRQGDTDGNGIVQFTDAFDRILNRVPRNINERLYSGQDIDMNADIQFTDARDRILNLEPTNINSASRIRP